MKQIKNALLIGATQGIGRETARLLAKQGYSVHLVGRNQALGNALARELNGHFIRADVSLLSDVRRVAEVMKTRVSALDLLIHSADVLLTKRETTAEGQERSIATNYLSRFLLNDLLLDLLRQAKQARIIHVAAAGLSTRLTAENFPPRSTASSFTSHNLGQAANDFYGLTFGEHYGSSGIRINVLNPGMVDTGIRRQGKGSPLLRGIVWLLETLMRPLMTSPQTYANLVTAIALGQLPMADQSVLLDRGGKPIAPPKDRLDRTLRQYVWQQTQRLVSSQSIESTQSTR